MANIKIKSSALQVENYILVVSLPIKKPFVIVRSQTVGQAEEFFIKQRDNETNPDRVAEFDRARALIKWAKCCNAELLEMHNADNKLMVSFVFSTVEDLIQFRDDMAVSVRGATATM